MLLASTYGRGSFAIRLAPIVFPSTPTNGRILTISNTRPANAPAPPPGGNGSGSDSGYSNVDTVTNSTTPVVEGLSEQSAFGNVVTVALFDVSETSVFTQDAINAILAGLPTLPDGTPTPRPIAVPLVAGTNATDATGRFAVQVGSYDSAGLQPYFRAFNPNDPNAPASGFYDANPNKPWFSDGTKRFLVQATNGSGTRGNFAPLARLRTDKFGLTGAAAAADPTAYSFLLDTTPPVAPGAPT